MSPPLQPYAPPQSHIAQSANPDADIADAATPLIAKAGGGVVLFTGAVFVLLALQTLVSINFYGAMKVFPYVILSVGAGLAVLGVSIFRAQGWAPIAALATGAIAFIVAAIWLVFSFANGIFGLFALGAPLLSMVSIAVSAVNMGPCKKASDARARLAASGLGFGL